MQVQEDGGLPGAGVRRPLRAGRAAGSARVSIVSHVCAGTAGALALIGLSGWIFRTPSLTRIFPGLATMKVDTAIMLLLLAASGLTRARTAASTVLATAAAVVAAATTLEYLTRHGLGIDQLLYTDPGGGAHPGRPSLVTAVSALLLSVAMLGPAYRRRWPAEALALVVFAASFVALLGYVYDVHSLYDIRPYASVAVHTASALLLLSLAALCGVERGVANWVVAASRPGALLMRIIAPGALVLLPAVGYLCVLAEHAGWATGDALIALIVVVCITALIAAAWVAGARLDRVDRYRRRALAQLHALTDDLEAQVAERSAQIRLRHDEMVLLAERQRIAADLHDVVVQRLFAAGMSLDSVDPAGLEPSVERRIDSAVESMDAAILDLRASIFELSRSTGEATDLTSALDRLCIEASRALGFDPDLTVDDPDDDSAGLRADILAVTRESLSNVAKHAKATAVAVTLRAHEDLLALEVVDNGVGLTAAPHSSGMQNMRGRAERLGGRCTWTPVEPRGTRVRWEVPREVEARTREDVDPPIEPSPMGLDALG